MNLDDFINEQQEAGRTRGRNCTVCAFFNKRPDLWAEAVDHRSRPAPTSWETIGLYLRRDHGATFSWYALRAHAINHGGIR